ncbi:MULTISPECIES: DUF6160 family protein [unclassified Acinetobacter]|uniref:putative pilus system protein FilA n=1 Tax=unclassified Acinetobacter TaxID=196816 RepID=UPI0015D28E76|nr:MULTISPECIES: DUF6160 family protein [unclassified Acinetobacter]
MKKFTKLALAASVAFSANAMAMQAMDDASLSETTGQDGLSIGIGISKIEIEKLFIHDNDGLGISASINMNGLVLDANNAIAYTRGTLPTNQGGAVVNIPTQTATYDSVRKAVNLGGTGGAAAITIYGNGIAGDANESHGIVIGANYDNNGAYLLTSRNLADLTIDSDAGAGNPFINIGAQVSGLDIKIGKIGIQASGTDDPTALRRGGTGVVNDILTGLSVKTGPMSANIQLGAAPQGAMVKLNANMIGGLTIQNLGILDNSTKQGDGDGSDAANRAAGVIHLDTIKVTDANSANLTLNQDISVFGATGAGDNEKGYVQILSTSGAHDMKVQGIRLGSADAKSIGDIEVQGMQTYYTPAGQQGVYHPGAVITIRGH